MSLQENMETKDFELQGREKETDFSTVTVKEEMHSDVSSELNDDVPENMNETVQRGSGEEEERKCSNDSANPFYFVGIKMEMPDDYESDTSFTSSVKNDSMEEYPNNPEKDYNGDVVGLNEMSSVNLNNPSCIDIKLECEEDQDNCKSDLQTLKDSSVPVDMHSNLDSNSIVPRCGTEHSSNEFIRGIECQEFPILCVNQEEKTDKLLAGKRNNPDFNKARESCESGIEGKALKGRKDVDGHLASSHSRGKVQSLPSAGIKNDLEQQQIQSSDSKGKVFSCDSCEASFSQRRNLEKHLRIHPGEKPFPCGICDVSFREKRYLKTHMQTHTGEKPYSCNYCESTFSHRYGLKIHERKHTGETPYSCGLCEATFKQSSNLRKHMQTHTGEKPIACTVCVKSFRDTSSLRKHMRTHTGETPYSCDVCGTSFSQRSNLRQHMKIHTGEKPFSCNYCESSFRIRYNLKRHMRIHSGREACP